MQKTTRLDTVVRLRERNEDVTQVALAQATRAFQQAECTLAEARIRAANDARVKASAGEWLVAEDAHRRALVEVRTAHVVVERARTGQEKARVACVEAHQRTEMVRRAVDRKVEEQRRADDRAERKQDDALSLLLRCG